MIVRYAAATASSLCICRRDVTNTWNRLSKCVLHAAVHPHAAKLRTSSALCEDARLLRPKCTAVPMTVPSESRTSPQHAAQTRFTVCLRKAPGEGRVWVCLGYHPPCHANKSHDASLMREALVMTFAQDPLRPWDPDFSPRAVPVSQGSTRPW